MRSFAGYTSIEHILDDDLLALSAVKIDSADLQRTIEERLRGLQPEAATSERELYARLVAARAFLVGGTELVAREDRLIAIVEKQGRELERLAHGVALTRVNPDTRLSERGEQAAANATGKFRWRRSVPLGVVAAALTFLWTSRSSFGISDSVLDTTGGWLLLSYLGALGLLAASWVVVRRFHRRDQKLIEELYDPGVQAAALDECSVGGNREFLRFEFSESLLAQGVGRLAGEVPRSIAGNSTLRYFTTIDPVREATVAADAGLERFEQLGWIVGKRSETFQLLYSVTRQQDAPREEKPD
jgi:hypothetical protein